MVELLEEMEGQLCLAEIRGEWMGGCHDGGLLLLDQPWVVDDCENGQATVLVLFWFECLVGRHMVWVQDCGGCRTAVGEGLGWVSGFSLKRWDGDGGLWWFWKEGQC